MDAFMNEYNKSDIANASFCLAKVRQKYSGLCKEVLNNIATLKSDNLIKQVTLENPPNDEVNGKSEIQNVGYFPETNKARQSHHIMGNQNIQSEENVLSDVIKNGTTNYVDDISRLVDNYSIIDNMILKSQNLNGKKNL